MKQQRTDARSLTADQQKRIEEVCFRSLALIGHNCEYLEQHFDRTGADESTRQAVADINAAAVKLDRTLSEAMTLLEFLRGDEKPQLYPVDLCDLLRQVAAQADMIRAQLGVEIHLDYGGWTSCGLQHPFRRGTVSGGLCHYPDADAAAGRGPCADHRGGPGAGLPQPAGVFGP